MLHGIVPMDPLWTRLRVGHLFGGMDTATGLGGEANSTKAHTVQLGGGGKGNRVANPTPIHPRRYRGREIDPGWEENPEPWRVPAPHERSWKGHLLTDPQRLRVTLLRQILLTTEVGMGCRPG